MFPVRERDSRQKNLATQRSHKKCSADFSANPLIALIATLDSAQVGLV